MQNKQSIGYDDTKRMLNTLRKLNENKSSSKPMLESIQENRMSSLGDNSGDPTEQTKNDIEVINDVDVKLISTDSNDLKLFDNQKNQISTIIDSFRSEISELAVFEPGFTINQNQIRLDGSIPDMDINFVLISGNESGLYINADMLKLEDENMEILEKLIRFEMSFKNAMDPIITDRNNN